MIGDEGGEDDASEGLAFLQKLMRTHPWIKIRSAVDAGRVGSIHLYCTKSACVDVDIRR